MLPEPRLRPPGAPSRARPEPRPADFAPKSRPALRAAPALGAPPRPLLLLFRSYCAQFGRRVDGVHKGRYYHLAIDAFYLNENHREPPENTARERSQMARATAVKMPPEASAVHGCEGARRVLALMLAFSTDRNTLTARDLATATGIALPSVY